jgi:DNA-directed RNA polymerase subunit RPC12/RpoP
MDFACKVCGSPAIVYPDRLDDDAAPVRCQRCNAIRCTLGEFRRLVEESGPITELFLPSRSADPS